MGEGKKRKRGFLRHADKSTGFIISVSRPSQQRDFVRHVTNQLLKGE